jgi:hypothetical protein
MHPPIRSSTHRRFGRESAVGLWHFYRCRAAPYIVDPGRRNLRRRGIRRHSLAGLIVIALVAAGCGGATKTVTVQSNATTSASAARSQNNAVVNQAAQGSDNKAQLGAAAIQKILTQKLGLNDTVSFNLNHHIAPGDNGGDCYVKLGADAVNFEYQTGNILRSPNGKDVVFVQSNTATPLVRCLVAVRSALGW